MSKKVIKDTEWVREQIPVKLDDDGNVVNKETGEPVGEKIFDIIGEGEPTKDINPDKEGVMYFDKTSGVIWVCTSNEEDNNIWKSNTGKFINSTINILDIFEDGSCIALYQFDGNVNDTGGEHDGTWDGTEDYDDGKFGKGAKFKDNSHISIDEITLSGDMSLSFWIKIVDDGEDYYVINNADSDKELTCVNVKNDRVRFDDSSDDSGTDIDCDLGTDLHHIVLVRKDSKITLYIDNDVLSSDNDCTNNDFVIKQFMRDEDGEVLLDQVRIFDRAVTDDEVRALYKEGGN